MAKKTEFQRRVSMLRKIDNYLKNKENEEKKIKKSGKSSKRRVRNNKTDNVDAEV